MLTPYFRPLGLTSSGCRVYPEKIRPETWKPNDVTMHRQRPVGALWLALSKTRFFAYAAKFESVAVYVGISLLKFSK